MLIIEDLVLLALDPVLGRPVWPEREGGDAQLAAAAVLLELLLDEHLPQRAPLPHAAMPPAHPLLASAAGALDGRAREPAAAIARLARMLPRLVERVLHGLCRRDIVHHVVRRRRLLLREHRWPLRSVQARNQAHARIYDAAINPVDMRGLSLLMLVDACGLLPQLIGAPMRVCAERRLRVLDGIGEDPMLNAIAGARACLRARRKPG